MEVLVYLVPLALALGLLGLAAFLWSLKSGQFDDLEGAAWRAIENDDSELPADRNSERRAPGTPAAGREGASRPPVVIVAQATWPTPAGAARSGRELRD
jgi:cbb3-type cytochrome oxidase maturation protein